MKGVLVVLLGVLVQSALAVRQYVEIERRPGPAHNFAGVLSLVFGLVMTFIAVVVGFLFVRAMAAASPKEPKTRPPAPVTPSAPILPVNTGTMKFAM